MTAPAPPAIWQDLLADARRAEVSAQLAAWLPRQRWFGGKGLAIKEARFVEIAPLSTAAAIGLIDVRSSQGDSSRYLLTLVIHAASENAILSVTNDANLHVADQFGDPEFAEPLLRLLAEKGEIQTRGGRLVGDSTSDFRAATPSGRPWQAKSLAVEQSNSAMIVEDQFFLKIYRRVEAGENPDAEIIAALTEQKFPYVPRLVSHLEFEPNDGERTTLALAQELVPGATGMWELTLAKLSGILSGKTTHWPPEERERAALLGKRTAQMHLALAGIPGRAFSPEPLTADSVRGIADSIVQEGSSILGQPVAGDASRLAELLPQFAATVSSESSAGFGQKIRCHGDYHLGQVLWSRGDIKILDFEGEPARPLAQRREKASPLKDVAGMIRSFDYARHVGLRELPANLRDSAQVRDLAAEWRRLVVADFVASYLKTTSASTIIPPSTQFDTVLTLYLVEKAIYELKYEMNNRPDWVDIPRAALEELLSSD